MHGFHFCSQFIHISPSMNRFQNAQNYVCTGAFGLNIGPKYFRIFIYKGPKMKLGSVCRADQAQFNGPTLRSLANFHIELEQFSCSLTAA